MVGNAASVLPKNESHNTDIQPTLYASKEKQVKRIFTTAILVISASMVRAEAIIDVTKIAGKTESEVSAHIGQPSSCGNSKHGKKCQYEKGETEIVFINGKADWITVEGFDQTPFSKLALSALGLKDARPSFSNNFTLRWNSIQGLLEVSVFKGASASDYAYIKVKTE